MPREDIESILERKVEALRKKDKSTEDRKVIDEVFDKETLLAVYKLMKEGIVDTVEFSISTGKEGNVFLATTPKGNFIALKIFRISTATFKRISRYIEGDPRFRGILGSHRKIIFAWTNKEFRNLHRLHSAGVRVPVPIRFHRNLLVMEYIGDENSPSPLLREVVLEDPEKVYNTLVDYVKRAYQKAELVHGDLSEYNVLIRDGEPVIIDCGQALLTEHPNAIDFLKRDVENLNRYFRRLGVNVMESESMIKMIVGG
ncbi:MAG TPA: serine protein kinase RIO [Methanomassiliicoccales archaeon]|nr:serine protein kinase RIO [Methanomassiliicoccales archaeon]